MFGKLIDPLVVRTTFAAGLLAIAGQALADEPIVTKAPAAALSTTSSACTGVWGFFVTDCPLSWYGVRFYGTIDTGGGYQTHGAPLDPTFAQGSSYLVQKMNRQPMWTLAPGALSTSAVGVLVDEHFAPGWAFIGPMLSRLSAFPARIAAPVIQKPAALPPRSNTESTSGRYASRRSLKSVAIIKTMAQTGITKAKSAVIYRSATSAGAPVHFHSTRSTNGRKTR
jgi:hypothetical protein